MTTGSMIAIFINAGTWAVSTSWDEKAYITARSADANFNILMCSDIK